MNEKPLNVGVVCYPTPGGSGVVAAELGKSLAGRGHKVHFITSGHPSRLDRFDENLYLHKVETGDYPVFQHYTPYSLSLAVKIREVADQYNLDLLHVHYAIPHAVSAFLAKEMLKPRRLPTITTLHGTDITLVGMMPSFYEVTRFSIAKSDGVTTVSQFLKEETIREFKIENHIEVIFNFVDGEQFKPPGDPRVREALAPRGEKLLVHVSNFRKVKNLPAVLDVFCQVRKAVPSRLVLIGDGPEREATERQAVEMGVAADVVFMGDQEYLGGVLPQCDVFLLPSEHESFGLAALEAMSCCVPVVGSRVGGLHEVIVHGETGYLCDPHDVECMSRLVIALLRDEKARKSLGQAARQRAIHEFDRERIVDQYLALYRRIVEEA